MMEGRMEKTGKLMAGGILLIVGAAFGLVGAIIMGVYSFFFFDMFFPMSGMPADESLMFMRFTQYMQMMYLGWAVILVIAAVLAVVGGVFAFKRRRWGWALTGSIASVVAFFPVGIAAVILVAQSKNEFEQAS
jgi:hypothetical protein